ncbi:unnamed protein product [Ceratitis capitata]|uniref:(Mediterranean fruit fly) hypothetical protein n=1 Tax=Ceratitis capitata TaxID=7213 RepID=A0A811VDD6_CERCA|nr:unnamed protein product [Ceratitis capitata]
MYSFLLFACYNFIIIFYFISQSVSLSVCLTDCLVHLFIFVVASLASLFNSMDLSVCVRVFVCFQHVAAICKAKRDRSRHSPSNLHSATDNSKHQRVMNRAAVRAPPRPADQLVV